MLSMNDKLTPDEIKKKFMKNTYKMKVSEYAQGSGILDISNLVK